MLKFTASNKAEKNAGRVTSLSIEFMAPGKSVIFQQLENSLVNATMTLAADEEISSLSVTLANGEKYKDVFKLSYDAGGIETDDLLVAGASAPNPTTKAATFSLGEAVPFSTVKGNIDACSALILEECSAAGITSKVQAAFIVGTARHETGEFSLVVEGTTGDEYENRTDIGNDQPGDGRKYIGRGFIQTTGKLNYTKLSQHLSLPLVDKPDLLQQDARVCAKVIVYCIHNLFAVTGNTSAHETYLQGDSLLSAGSPTSPNFDELWEKMSRIVNVYSAVNGGQALIDVIEKYKDSYSKLESGTWNLGAAPQKSTSPNPSPPADSPDTKLAATTTNKPSNAKKTTNVDSSKVSPNQAKSIKGNACLISVFFGTIKRSFVFVHTGTDYSLASNTITFVFFSTRILASASERLSAIPMYDLSLENIFQELVGLPMKSSDTAKVPLSKKDGDMLIDEDNPLKSATSEAYKRGFMVTDSNDGFTTLKDLTLPRVIWELNHYNDIQISDKARGETQYTTRKNDNVIKKSKADSKSTQVKPPNSSDKKTNSDSPSIPVGEQKSGSTMPQTAAESNRQLTLIRAYETVITCPLDSTVSEMQPGDGIKFAQSPIDEVYTISGITWNIPGGAEIRAYIPVMGKALQQQVASDIAGAAPSETVGGQGSGAIRWPVNGTDCKVLMAFGEYDPIQAAGFRGVGHNGLDITCGADKTLYAECNGVISYIHQITDSDNGAGLYYVLESDDEDVCFWHFHCEIVSVKIGQKVKINEPCGKEGHSAFGNLYYYRDVRPDNPGTPHLHLEVRKKDGSQHCNPRDYFRDKGLSWQPENINQGGHETPPGYLGRGVTAKKSW
jgi:murein DD-endopeptidase MepM/ murein hydrolase activator NlpD